MNQPAEPTPPKKTEKIIKLILTDWLPNLLLSVGVILLINLNLEIFAFGLVGLSKWQVLRGGRKLWMRNIRDNACDLVMALSSVMLMVLFTGEVFIQVAIGAIYYLWLIIVKPLRGHIGVGTQAAICQFFGLWVVFLLARDFPAAAIVALAWAVALISADHLVSAFHERAHFILALAWAFIVAEISWLFWHWLITYSFFDGRLSIPQPALVVGLTGYIFGNMYIDHMQTKLGRRRLIEYVLLMFGLSVVLILGSQWDSQL